MRVFRMGEFGNIIANAIGTLWRRDQEPCIFGKFATQLKLSFAMMGLLNGVAVDGVL